MPRKTRIKAIPGTRRRMTELLLAESVPNLGEQGEIVRVRAGYARNFLIPQGYATIATEPVSYTHLTLPTIFRV